MTFRADEKAKLKARLAEIETAEQAEAEARYKVIGRVVMKAADGDPAFADRLRKALDEGVIKKRERSLLGLSEKTGGAGETEPAAGQSPGDRLSDYSG